jgi:hypothetical protein
MLDLYLLACLAGTVASCAWLVRRVPEGKIDVKPLIAELRYWFCLSSAGWNPRSNPDVCDHLRF